eukprot:2007659-Amphidinium_carterae.1
MLLEYVRVSAHAGPQQGLASLAFLPWAPPPFGRDALSEEPVGFNHQAAARGNEGWDWSTDDAQT